MRLNRIATNESGFSAIELLITLFIAAAFTTTGYQLYSLIIKDGGDAQTRARASNIGYDNLRRYAAQTTEPCTVFTPSPTPTIPANSRLGGTPSITVTISCPYGTSMPVTKVSVSVRYGNVTPQREVVHAIFVTQ